MTELHTLTTMNTTNSDEQQQQQRKLNSHVISNNNANFLTENGNDWPNFKFHNPQNPHSQFDITIDMKFMLILINIHFLWKNHWTNCTILSKYSILNEYYSTYIRTHTTNLFDRLAYKFCLCLSHCLYVCMYVCIPISLFHSPSPSHFYSLSCMFFFILLASTIRVSTWWCYNCTIVVNTRAICSLLSFIFIGYIQFTLSSCRDGEKEREREYPTPK